MRTENKCLIRNNGKIVLVDDIINGKSSMVSIKDDKYNVSSIKILGYGNGGETYNFSDILDSKTCEGIDKALNEIEDKDQLREYMVQCGLTNEEKYKAKLYEILNTLDVVNHPCDDYGTITYAVEECFNKLKQYLDEGDMYEGETTFKEKVYEIAFGDNAIDRGFSNTDVLEQLQKHSDDALYGEELEECLVVFENRRTARDKSKSDNKVEKLVSTILDSIKSGDVALRDKTFDEIMKIHKNK